MLRKVFLIAAITLSLNFYNYFVPRAFSEGSAAADYLCEIAAGYYNHGEYSEALNEFKKVLMIDPQNKTALAYISKLTGNSGEKNNGAQDQPAAYREEALLPAAASQEDNSREAAINRVLDTYNSADLAKALKNTRLPSDKTSIQGKNEAEKKEPAIKVSGELQISAGINSQGETIWNRSNFDLNEKNWRILSYDVYNNGYNTYDPAIYDRLKVIVETPEEDNGFGFHLNLTVDPWSFTGKTATTNVSSSYDNADVQLKYFGSNEYAFGSTVYTNQANDSFNISQIKAVNGKTTATAVSGNWPYNTFYIPSLKVDYTFQPIREFWVDYKQDDYLKLRVFPMATDKQAYSSDDPLKLSNNHIYWEDSPWLRAWHPGKYNSSSGTFTKGYWDDSISFNARDSLGNRLTALRGFSLDLKPSEDTFFTTNWATPKDPWQDYSDIDNIGGATRLKHNVGDNLSLGLTHTMRLGLVDNDTIDSRDQVLAGDAAYQITEGTKAVGEVAASRSKYDITNSTYTTQARGNAYLFSIVNRYPRKDILNSSFEQIRADKDENFMSKFRFLCAHMDKGFDPALSSYRQTRQDSFWSRHLHFRQPLDYFYQSLFYPSMGSDDLEAFAIGDGIDAGRDVIGMRWVMTWQEQFSNLFDVRNVHNVNGRYIETVARDEAEWKISDKLTAKAMGIYQDMPKTTAGVDPFIYDSLTGDYLLNSAVKGGDDPSLKTGSLGLEYAFTDWLRINGIYELTNDYTLAYGNFPEGILSSSNMGDNYTEYGNNYIRELNYLYSQQYFPQAPYPTYNVYKAGLMLIPMDKLQVYFDATWNEYKKAGQISDGMNHYGVEIGYLPTNKLGLYLRYTYSMWQDLDRVIEGDDKTIGHHNIFISTRYMLSKNQEFELEYGVSPNYPIIESTTSDPLGGSLQTIDTVHIIRFYYRLKF